MTPDEKTYWTVAGFVFTWVVAVIGGVLGYGKATGKSEAEAEQLRKDIDDLKQKQKDDIAKVEKTITEGFYRIEGYFKTSEGDQRFLTENKHAVLCNDQKEHWQMVVADQREIFNKINSMAISVGKIEEKIG